VPHCCAERASPCAPAPLSAAQRIAARRGTAAGFLLIEVLVALALVGLIMTAIFTVYGNGRLWHGGAGDVDEALSVADAKLAAVGVAGTLHLGERNGIFAGRFRWRLTVAPYEDRDRNGAAAEPVAPLFRLFQIKVTVSWYQGRHARHVALATLRLAPAPP
jgi:hypothetical protein